MKSRQAIPKFAPGTLLNLCHLHQTKKHTSREQLCNRYCSNKHTQETHSSYSFIMMESEGKGNVRKLRLRERKREGKQVQVGIRTLLNLFCQHTLCDKAVSLRRQNSIYLVHCQRESTTPPPSGQGKTNPVNVN